jgi:hypothetical protein
MAMTENRNATCAERIQAHADSRAEDVRKMLAASQGQAVCRHCGQVIEKITEEYATYWQDEEGDSLSYVPSLHDHEPDPDYTEDSLYEFGLGITRKVMLRFDMSTGGPADWLEILCDEEVGAGGWRHLYVDRVTYHFSDWFDHAEMPVDQASPLWQLAEWVADTGSQA